MEEWEEDESVPDDVSFEDWVRANRPDLALLLDTLPPPSRPEPYIEPHEPDDE